MTHHQEPGEMLFPTDPMFFEGKEIVEVLYYYDGPKAYTFYTQSDDFYLAYFGDLVDGLEEWIFIPTSEVTIHKLVEKKLSIRSVFKLAQTCYLVTIGEKIEKIERINFEDLDRAEYVPNEGLYFRSNQTLLNIRLKKKGLSPGQLPETAISKIIQGARKLFKTTMRIVKEKREDVFHELLAKPQFALIGVSRGSVNLLLKPIEVNPLINEAMEAIQKVLRDDTSDFSLEERESIARDLIDLAPKGTSRIYDFDSVEFSGLLADGGVESKSFSFELSNTQREALMEKYMPETTLISAVLTGIAEAGDNAAETFELRHLSKNDLNLKKVACRFDMEEVESSLGEETTPAKLMMEGSQGNKVRVTGIFNSKTGILDAQSIQIIPFISSETPMGGDTSS
jgi:hypothetical protein